MFSRRILCTTVLDCHAFSWATLWKSTRVFMPLRRNGRGHHQHISGRYRCLMGVPCKLRFPYIFNFLYAWHLFSIQYRNPVVLFPGRRFVCRILSLCLKQWGLINKTNGWKNALWRIEDHEQPSNFVQVACEIYIRQREIISVPQWWRPRRCRRPWAQDSIWWVNTSLRCHPATIQARERKASPSSEQNLRKAHSYTRRRR